MGWCGGASELIGVRQSGACARPAGSDWCAARRWFGLISCIRVHRLGECHGTPILWHTFGVPRTLHTERHVHGTPILCTWHTHIMAQFTHPWRSEGGARCGRVSVKARRCGLHVPRDGSGEPARAWSPAWDTIAASPCRAPGVTFVLPRWHTQRSGRCPNSRYLYGQRRGLPLSSTTCPARRSPSSILRHRPPVTRF